jgi:glutathione S-transferase
MQLIGMLDSPYVRRVAISMHLMEIPFEHRPLSVFRNYDDFAAFNPVVKAPTLVCDDGTVLIDSTLILDYLEGLDAGRHRLMPVALAERKRVLRVVGLALAAMEKSVQTVYETRLRPQDKQHAPWLERITEQMGAAWHLLEEELGRQPLTLDALDQAGISCAVAWRFAREMLPDKVPDGAYPLLQQWGLEAESHPAFVACPFE